VSNEQKNPLARTLPEYIRREIRNWVARNGKAMPGHVQAVSGAIVTVSFDVTDLILPLVRMPVMGAEYIRLPIQVGDKGGCLPFDYYMGGVSGLGSAATSDSSSQGNLATLMWVPMGSSNWLPSPNANALVLYGPQGVIVQDKAGTSPDYSATVNSSGITLTGGGYTFSLSSSGISMTGGGHTVALNSSGLDIDGTHFGTHEHANVTTGTGTSGAPVPGS